MTYTTCQICGDYFIHPDIGPIRALYNHYLTNHITYAPRKWKP